MVGPRPRLGSRSHVRRRLIIFGAGIRRSSPSPQQTLKGVTSPSTILIASSDALGTPAAINNRTPNWGTACTLLELKCVTGICSRPESGERRRSDIPIHDVGREWPHSDGSLLRLRDAERDRLEGPLRRRFHMRHRSRAVRYRHPQHVSHSSRSLTSRLQSGTCCGTGRSGAARRQ